jgi:hypothetical protein
VDIEASHFDRFVWKQIHQQLPATQQCHDGEAWSIRRILCKHRKNTKDALPVNKHSPFETMLPEAAQSKGSWWLAVWGILHLFIDSLCTG